MIDVFALPGTGWPNGGDGVTEDFLSRLDHSRFNPKIVPYPATFGGHEQPYATSKAAGQRALIDAIRATDNLAIVAGYSQGAVIAGDLAAEIGWGLHPELEIVAAALIADGARPVGGGVPNIAPTPFYGITGQRHVPAERFPTYWAAAPGDPITACPPGNPLRALPEAVEWFSIASPEAALQWGAKMLDAAVRGRFQDWWNPIHWRTWSGALAYARGYLFDGRHGAAYITEGYNQQLADAVNHLGV